MFLDDKLLQICKEWDCSTPEKIQELNQKLCRECESYYKTKLNPSLSKYEVKTILDRTFNLWDSFVRMALENKDTKLIVLGAVYKEYSFKSQLMKNDEIVEIYIRL